MNNNKTVSQTVEKYKDQISKAVRLAVRLTRGCVLYFGDLKIALDRVINDDGVFKAVWGALRETLRETRDGLRLGDATVYTIYADPDPDGSGVVVVDIGNRLTDSQLEILRELGKLFGVSSYYKYSEVDGKFFESMPMSIIEREEVYVTIHNLLLMWTGCGGDEEEEDEEEDGEEEP